MASAMNHTVRPFLLAACCLASVGHLDAVQPNRPGGNYEFYKGRVLREVRQRMKSSATATAHETVSALALLTSFEMSRCSEEALTHLQGLKTIAGSSVPTMLETLDLLHAILFDSTLIFDTYGAIYPADYEEETQCLKEQSTILSLLHTEHEEALHASSNAQVVLIMKHHGPLMQSMSSAILGAVGNARDASTASEAQRAVLDTYRQRLDDFWGSTCRLDRAIDNSVHLAQACYFQHSLLHTAIASGALSRSEGSRDLVRGLYDSLRNIDDAAWASLPYTHLVILLYGAATARHAGHKSYLKAQLVKIIYQLGPKEWRRSCMSKHAPREPISGFQVARGMIHSSPEHIPETCLRALFSCDMRAARIGTSHYATIHNRHSGNYTMLYNH
nr:hypothetical protein CFP56_21656 [Quercus suber]